MAGSTRTWIGTTSSDPTLDTNWSPTGHPHPGDTAIIPGGATTPPIYTDTSISNITFDLTGNGQLDFTNNTSAPSDSSIDALSVIDATGTATALLLTGPFTSAGTIEVTGSHASLTVSIAAGSAAQGSLNNQGQIIVDQGDTLAINGGTIFDQGAVVVNGGFATIGSTIDGLANFAIGTAGTLELNQAANAALTEITFTGTTGLLKLAQPASFDGNIGIGNFAVGDTIDLGPVNVSTVVFDGQGDVIAIGSSGTVFDAAVGPFENQATFVLSGTGGLAGNLLVSEGSGDTVVTVLPPSVWLWKDGASAPGNTPSDWTVVGGPGNGWGYPQPDDTAINTGGTIFLSDPNFISNTFEVGGTAGVAALTISGNSQTSFSNPTIDQNSLITSAEPATGVFKGSTTPETTLLNAQGIFINEGTIDADGPAGSSFTIAISGTVIDGTFQPGAFINYDLINYDLIEVDAGNSMTITVAGTSEMFNAGEILVNGGSLQIDAAADALGGGYAPGSGVVLIQNGGTVETNVGYASDVEGDIPVYAFAGTGTGNTLKIDNIGSFGGVILGFGPNDTIDLGTSIDVTAIAYSNTTGILSLESNGTVAGSVLLGSGKFQTFSGSVAGGTADGFIFGTGADGDTVITTAVTNDVYANTSGTWQMGSLWSGGTPGSLDTAIVGLGASNPFTLTTGTAPVSVGALVLAGSKSLLSVTSDTTVGPYLIRDYGGTLEVTSGNTLVGSGLVVDSGLTQIDPNALLDLTGHVTYGSTGANNGTIAATNAASQALRVDSGSLLVNGGTLNAGPGQAGGPGGRIYVGFEGGGTPASMTVQNSGAQAGVVTDTYAIVGSDPTSFGVLTLDGNVSWTDEVVPTDTQSNRGYMIVGFDSQATITGSFTPAFSGAATLTVENGATLTEQSYADIADTPDSAGNVLVSDGARWNIGISTIGTNSGGFLDVGRLGDALLTVAQGGVVQVGGSLVGFVNNGTLLNGSGINVGVSAGAVGTLDIESGGTVAMVGDSGFSAGRSADATGLIIVNGPGALISEGAAGIGIGIGDAGSGTLEIEGGGKVALNGTSTNSGIGIGQTLGGSGLVIVSGSNSLLSLNTPAGSVHVGDFGQGTLDIQSGGVVSATATGVIIGVDSGGGGTVTVSGAGSSLLSLGPSGGMIVGDLGFGTLTVDNGGHVATAARMLIANSSTASGTALVQDATVSVGGSLVVGDKGSGLLTIEDGGLVNVNGNAIDIGDQSGSSGFVDINSGNAMLEGGSLSVGNGSATGVLKIDAGGTVEVTTATVGQHGKIVLAGGVLDPITVTLAAGGSIGGFGTLDANLDNNSTVTATGGKLEATGTVGGSGTMAIDANAFLVLPGTVGPGQIVDFTVNSGVLQVGTIGFDGTIDGMQPGDTIIVTGVTNAVTAFVDPTDILHVVRTTFADIDLQLDPTQSYLGDTFHVNTVGGNTVVTETPCYLEGTRILTDRGEIRVEKLCIGDRVITLDGTARPIKWIGRRSYSGALPAGLRDVIPILIKRGALGKKLPKRDLIVSPLHAMYCDGVLVPAEHLVNGTTICRAPDIDPIRYFHIELDQHDVIYADGAPAETFVDCDSRAMFHNAAEFDTLYPGDATPRWQYCAPRVEGGERLAAIKRAIDRRAGIELPAQGAPPGRLEGRLDGIEGGRIAGWAFHPDRPAAQVWLEVLDGDGVIARVHAGRYRADLEAAGIGDGRHGFELHLTGQMRTRREIRVRRVEDGVELDGSPLVVEARGGQALLEDARRVIAAAILDPSDEAALDELAAELLHGVDALRQVRVQRVRPTAAGVPGGAHRGRPRRALIIDAQLPRPEHDAGSQAVLSHAAALTALGFQVEFVAAHELARAEQASVALEEAGYVVHRAPRVASVEEVLRRHRNAFDVVYLHRLANAEAYAPLARAWQARARLLYCVADLHHVRLARQAAVQASAEVADVARAMRVRELNAMRQCDAVITHSTAEAAYLARAAPGASVHVVAWTPGARPRPVPLAARQGVAAIGSWSHEPNVDAVRWLVSDIMPRVWAEAPRIELLVVGSDWPARVPWITDKRMRLVGAVTSIETLLGMLRVSVAPLRFGAGLKGKVLDSFACEVPCVMTPVAAEGFPLEGTLPGLVAEDAATLASLIVRLHEDAPFHRAAAGDGLALTEKFSRDAVRAAMAAAVGVPAQEPGAAEPQSLQPRRATAEVLS